MTPPQNLKPAESPTGKTAKGFALKLAVVLIAVGVYFGLNWLEALKTYHNRPFMIVEGSEAEANDTEAKGFAALRVSRLYKELEATTAASPGGKPGQADADRAALRDMISQDLTYRPFRSEDEIVVALNDSIREHRDEEKKRLTGVQESMKKQLAAYSDEMNKVKDRLSALISPTIKADVPEEETKGLTSKEKEKLVKEATAKLTDEARAKGVEARIKTLRDDKANAASEARLFTLKNDKREGTETEKTSLALYDAGTKESDLAVWLNTLAARESALENRNEDWKELDNKIKAADESARNQLRIANVTFRAKLEQSRAELRGQSARLLDIGPVFREGSGAYVIYQTCRTVALVLLVFAVLSVFLLMLRIIPFFASASTTLTGQLGDLFKTSGGGGGGDGEGGGGGVPQLARSIVMTAAALGVGTAVVVAGNSLSDKGPRMAVAGSSTSDDDPEGYYAPVYRPTNVKYDNGKTGKGGDSKTEVAFTPDIIYPEPLVINHEVPVFVGGGGRSGGGVLSLPKDVTDTMEKLIGTGADVIKLTNTITTAQKTADEAKLAAGEAKKTADGVSTIVVGGRMSDKLEGLNSQVPLLQAATAELQKESQYRGWQMFQLQNNVGRTLEGLSDTNVMLMGRQNSGGRNVLTSTRQFFFKRNHYMVTGQVLTALRKVMCGPESCKARDPKDLNEVAAAEEKERLLLSLAAMMGRPPQTEGDFIDALKDSLYRQLNSGRERNGTSLAPQQAGVLKDWKSVVLKYARVSY